MKKIVLLSALCLSLAFAACDKDEENGGRTYEEIMLAPTDLEGYGLFGKVKKYTAILWVDCAWENNAIVTANGYIKTRVEVIFNESGYGTSFKSYYRDNSAQEFYLDEYYTYEYDSRNRLLVKYNLDSNDQVESKEEYVYNDANKTATIYLSYMEGGELVKSEYVYVCQLNKYGRIDWGNYEWRSEKETRSDKYVTKYDSHGNKTEYYNVYNDYVWSYYAYAYEYYK